jgi:hypothetical protein
MKLPVVTVTAFWKWFWFACAALSLKGPQFVEIVGVLQLPAAVHLASFVVGLAGLLLTLQIHPTPTPAPPAPPTVSGQRGFVDTGVMVMLSVGALVIAMFCGVVACGPKTGPIANDVGQIVLTCGEAILSAVQSGQTTFEEIAAALTGSACGPITATEVEAIVQLLTGTGGDAGTLPYNIAKAAAEPGLRAKLLAVHHKVSP